MIRYNADTYAADCLVADGPILTLTVI